MKNILRIIIILVVAAGVWLALQYLPDKNASENNKNSEPKYEGVVFQTMPDSFLFSPGAKTMQEASVADKKTIKFDQNTKFELIAIEEGEDPVSLEGNISYLKPGVEAEIKFAEGSVDLASTIVVKQLLEPIPPPDSR